MSCSITNEKVIQLNRIVEVLVNTNDCDSVILGCTELPIVYSEANSKVQFPFPVISSITALAEDIIDFCYS